MVAWFSCGIVARDGVTWCESAYFMASLRGREKQGQRKHDLDMSVYQGPVSLWGGVPSRCPTTPFLEGTPLPYSTDAGN